MAFVVFYCTLSEFAVFFLQENRIKRKEVNIMIKVQADKFAIKTWLLI